jgi:uncharacterized integral membrane protein (TIGR00698 family)
VTTLVTPPIALAAGAALALTMGNPLPDATRRWASWLLQAAVIGLGFGVPLRTVVTAGVIGLGYTAIGIVAAVTIGLALGRWLAVDRQTSMLVTAGTSICGGSAIAAVGPAIGARPEAMSVALATVFVLNAVALYLFPPIGRLLELSQHQFAVWAALAIHDTSSVVGAASSYGAEALKEATVLKLARALWIVPLTFAAAWLARRELPEAPRGGGGVRLPWFIGLFVLAAVVRSVVSGAALARLDAVASLARHALTATLFLIGMGLTRATLHQVGVRALVQGVLLWLVLGVAALVVVMALPG